MNDFKQKIESITSKKPSNWKSAADERAKKPWFGAYSALIARRVLASLEESRMSQARLAEEIGVKPQQISKIVKGKQNMTLETIYKLSKALNFELITFPPYKYSRPEKKSPMYSVVIDSETHLLDKEKMSAINIIIGQNTTGTGTSGFQSLNTQELMSLV